MRGWIGEDLRGGELAGSDGVLEGLDGELGLQHADLLTGEGIEEFDARYNWLRPAWLFPAPRQDTFGALTLF